MALENQLHYITGNTPDEADKHAIELYLSEASSGRNGIVLTRVPAKDLDERLCNPKLTKLAKNLGKYEEALSPTNLGLIVTYLKDPKNRVILMIGAEYLIQNNSFATVHRWLEDLYDSAIEGNATFIIPIYPKTLSEREYAQLVRYHKVLTAPAETPKKGVLNRLKELFRL